MIKIFAEDADKQILLDWQQTNGFSLPVHATSEATGLGISTFPCLAKITGSSVSKTYASSIDEFMQLSLEQMTEIKASI